MQRFLVAILTVVVFAAGFGARVWTEQAPAVPAPPLVQGLEFNPKSSTDTPRGGPPRMSRTQMISTIEQNAKQIEVYRNRVDELDRDFEAKFIPLLTPGQRQQFADDQKRSSDFAARIKAQANSKEVLTDDQIDRLRNNPLNNVLRMIQPKERADRLKTNYSLDDKQYTQVLSALNYRRDQFLSLIDQTPNPSIRYSDLAQIVERIANPAILEQEKRDLEKREKDDKDRPDSRGKRPDTDKR